MQRALYTGDCLAIMDEHIPDSSIDLIYLDPPFNSNSRYNLPFKNKDRSLRPVEAFKDTWKWTERDTEDLRRLERNPLTRSLADLIKFAGDGERGIGTRGKSSLAAYLMNMTLRLRAMRRVLKDSGSIYLHCDPTASHYLKLVMDAIFGKKNFRNEIIWSYNKWTNAAKYFQRNHDVLLFYSKTDNYTFNKQYWITAHKAKVLSRGWDSNKVSGGIRQLLVYDKKMAAKEINDPKYDKVVYLDDKPKGTAVSNVWHDIPYLASGANERLGYPTQKPLALLERIIKASSNEGDLILDTFCGCGTTVHAAEALDRRWIGIDISPFSTGLMRERILHNFKYLRPDDISMWGAPDSIEEAERLASKDKFEFEKWVCGRIGANGMYKNPGERGADGGVDGVMEIDVIRKGKVHEEYVIIQVKGGHVSPDSVKALSETVRRLEAVAGIMVCFGRQMRTVENQRSRETWSDDYETYPVIQGYSIEDLLQDKPPKLPPRYGRRRGARIQR